MLRRLGWCASLAALLLGALTLLASPASAATVQLQNSGFETGNTAGWSGGYVTTFDQLAPYAGRFMGGIGGGSANTWVEMSQAVTLAGGDKVDGVVFFNDNDGSYYNDKGQLLVRDSSGGETSLFFAQGSTGSTNWTPWSFTAPAAGTYRVVARAMNGRDSAVPSPIYLDSTQLAAAPPTVTMQGVANGASYEKGNVPPASCQVVDGGAPFTIGASQGAITGPFAAYGLGQRTAGCSYTSPTSGLSGSAAAVYSIVDTTAPTLVVPTGVVVEATGSDGAVAEYTTSGVDAVDPNPSVLCTTPSGETFALGVTSVSCTATDVVGNATTEDFTVEVTDTTGPALSIPAEVVFEAAGPAGAVVTYDAAAADLVDGAVPVTCTTPSGTEVDLGTLVVDCSAQDSRGNVSEAGFSVIVRDTTAPALTVPTAIIAEASSADGAVVTYDASATDLVDGPVAIECTPGSGTTFALGDATVGCSASDAALNEASASFGVSVVDTTAPVLTLAGVAVEATGPDGAVANFAATATDIVSGDLTVDCDAVSGDVFALGTTTVTCSAVDAAGNETTGTLTVAVADTTAPALSVAPPATTEATGPDGAVVAFTATATDVVDGTLTVDCDAASGDTFALGTTTVSCTVADAAGNTSSVDFVVEVVDTTAPALQLPAGVTVNATSTAGAVVTYAASATDAVDGTNAVGCTPASGATFAPGATVVTCTTEDAAGNAATASFTVNVRYAFTGIGTPSGKTTANAGQSVPLTFRLGGFRGMDVITSSASVGPDGDVVATRNPGSSSLSYDAGTQTYQYVWKTEKAWAKATRTVTIVLADGTAHSLTINFTK